MTPARSYSLIRHVALSIWLNADLERCHMSMFTAFYDASGHPKQGRALFVTGVVSSVAHWLEFEGKWKRTLKAHGLTYPFHMTDWATSSTPEYKEWEGDLPRQTEFHKAVAKLLREYTATTVSQGIVLADYRRIRREYELPVTVRTPLTYCATGALVMLLESWQKQTGLPKDAQLKHVYESGDTDWGEWQRVARKHLGFDPIPMGKSDAAPLQLADYLAWEHRKHIHERWGTEGRRPRKSFLVLNETMPESQFHWKFGHYDKMVEGFEEMKIPHRHPTKRAS